MNNHWESSETVCFMFAFVSHGKQQDLWHCIKLTHLWSYCLPTILLITANLNLVLSYIIVCWICLWILHSFFKKINKPNIVFLWVWELFIWLTIYGQTLFEIFWPDSICWNLIYSSESQRLLFNRDVNQIKNESNWSWNENASEHK